MNGLMESICGMVMALPVGEASPDFFYFSFQSLGTRRSSSTAEAIFLKKEPFYYLWKLASFSQINKSGRMVRLTFRESYILGDETKQKS